MLVSPVRMAPERRRGAPSDWGHEPTVGDEAARWRNRAAAAASYGVQQSAITQRQPAAPRHPGKGAFDPAPRQEHEAGLAAGRSTPPRRIPCTTTDRAAASPVLPSSEGNSDPGARCLLNRPAPARHPGALLPGSRRQPRHQQMPRSTRGSVGLRSLPTTRLCPRHRAFLTASAHYRFTPGARPPTPPPSNISSAGTNALLSPCPLGGQTCRACLHLVYPVRPCLTRSRRRRSSELGPPRRRSRARSRD